VFLTTYVNAIDPSAKVICPVDVAKWLLYRSDKLYRRTRGTMGKREHPVIMRSSRFSLLHPGRQARRGSRISLGQHIEVALNDCNSYQEPGCS
jgi:hypothetical protein